MATFLGDLILMLAPPNSFILFAFLMIAEILIARSILEDMKAANIKIPSIKIPAIIIPSIKMPLDFSQLAARFVNSSASLDPEQAILSLVSQNSNMSIKDISVSMSLSTWTTRKLMQNLVAKGYVTRQVDVNMRGRRAFCYTAAPSYDRQLKQYMRAAAGFLPLMKNN